jgi:hypothetical protein
MLCTNCEYEANRQQCVWCFGYALVNDYGRCRTCGQIAIDVRTIMAQMADQLAEDEQFNRYRNELKVRKDPWVRIPPLPLVRDFVA